MAVYAYLRVSTGKQDSDNQRVGVDALAERMHLHIDQYIEDEGVSGTKEPEKRELGKLLKMLKPGDVLLAGEISRLGRSLFMVMRILEYCMEHSVRVLTAKDGYELGDNIQSKVLAFAFGLAAEIERNMISQRTAEALRLRKANGVRLGRPPGRRSAGKLAGREDEIRELLDSGLSKEKAAKRLGVNRNTLQKFAVEAGLCERKPEPEQTRRWREAHETREKFALKNTETGEYFAYMAQAASGKNKPYFDTTPQKAYTWVHRDRAQAMAERLGPDWMVIEA